MSTRAYIVLGLIVAVIALGIVLAEVQRATKTAELLDDLDHDSPDVAVDTMADLVERGGRIEDGPPVTQSEHHAVLQRGCAEQVAGAVLQEALS